jgi:hypothetical protein
MEKDQLKHQEELRGAYLKRLRVLELQAAKLGLETPASIRIEIEELRETIASIDQILAAARQETKEQVTVHGPAGNTGNCLI